MRWSTHAADAHECKFLNDFEYDMRIYNVCVLMYALPHLTLETDPSWPREGGSLILCFRRRQLFENIFPGWLWTISSTMAYFFGGNVYCLHEKSAQS